MLLGASSSTSGFAVSSHVGDGDIRLALSGELDIATVPHLEDALAAAEDARDGQLTLDLSDLSFIDSTGLRGILQLHARAEREEWSLVVVPGPAAVQRVFELTGTEQILNFVPLSRSAEDAAPAAG